MSVTHGLFVDDVREPPKNDDLTRPENKNVVWTVARTFHEAIFFLEKFTYDVVSLDHDLASFYGNREMTGDDVLQWLISRKIQGAIGLMEVRVHSANVAKRRRMTDNANAYFNNEYFLKKYPEYFQEK